MTQEGNQYVKGFSGIGGILKYKMDKNPFLNIEEEDEDDAEFI